MDSKSEDLVKMLEARGLNPFELLADIAESRKSSPAEKLQALKVLVEFSYAKGDKGLEGSESKKEKTKVPAPKWVGKSEGE